MTQITEVFSSDRPRGGDAGGTRLVGGLLRLPGWRRLVLGLSAIGALLILAATYSVTTARELDRARLAAAEEAAVLAEVMEGERAALGPLVAALRLLVAGPALGDGGDPLPALERALGAMGIAPGEVDVVLDRPGAPRRRLRGVAAPPAALIARARAEGAVSAPAPAPAGETAPRLWRAWTLTGADGAVLAVSRRSAAFSQAWAGVTGTAALVDAGGRVLVASTPGAAGADFAAWRAQRLRADDLAATAPVGAGDGAPSLTAHVLYPRRVVSEAVRDVLSIEIMIMSLLATLAFFMDSQATQRAYSHLSADADALKSLNARLRDEIAERKRVEAALAQASKLAALGQMSAAVAHELNQPLAAMRTYLAAARQLGARGEAAAAADNLDRIDALIGRMAALTRDLKAVARQERAAPRPTDLVVAARQAAEILEARACAAGAVVTLSVPEAPQPVIAAAHRLEQIVVNLLQNALDAVAGRPDAAVSLALRDEDGSVVLSVEDNGPGLPPGDPDQVFAPFFTTKPAGEGLGLGLAISSAIAEELGGTLAAAPRPGGGARFSLSLPRAQRQADEGA